MESGSSSPKAKYRQKVKAVGDSWVVSKSTTYPGHVYYFNTLTGQSVWNLSESELGKATMTSTTSVGPEPTNPPTEINETNIEIYNNHSYRYHKVMQQKIIHHNTEIITERFNPSSRSRISMAILPSISNGLTNEESCSSYLSQNTNTTTPSPQITVHHTGMKISNRFKHLNVRELPEISMPRKITDDSTVIVTNTIQNNEPVIPTIEDRNVDLRDVLRARRRVSFSQSDELGREVNTEYQKQDDYESVSENHQNQINEENQNYSYPVRNEYVDHISISVPNNQVETEYSTNNYADVSNETEQSDQMSAVDAKQEFVNQKDACDDYYEYADDVIPGYKDVVSDEEWIPQNSYLYGETRLIDLRSLKSLFGSKNLERGWLIIADTNVFLLHLKLLSALLDSDGDSRVLVTRQCQRELSRVAYSRLGATTTAARAATRYLETLLINERAVTVDSILPMLNDINGCPTEEDVYFSCLKYIQESYPAIILTSDNSLTRIPDTITIPKFTVAELKWFVSTFKEDKTLTPMKKEPPTQTKTSEEYVPKSRCETLREKYNNRINSHPYDKNYDCSNRRLYKSYDVVKDPTGRGYKTISTDARQPYTSAETNNVDTAVQTDLLTPTEPTSIDSRSIVTKPIKTHEVAKANASPRKIIHISQPLNDIPVIVDDEPKQGITPKKKVTFALPESDSETTMSNDSQENKNMPSTIFRHISVQSKHSKTVEDNSSLEKYNNFNTMISQVLPEILTKYSTTTQNALPKSDECTKATIKDNEKNSKSNNTHATKCNETPKMRQIKLKRNIINKFNIPKNKDGEIRRYKWRRKRNRPMSPQKSTIINANNSTTVNTLLVNNCDSVVNSENSNSPWAKTSDSCSSKLDKTDISSSKPNVTIDESSSYDSDNDYISNSRSSILSDSLIDNSMIEGRNKLDSENNSVVEDVTNLNNLHNQETNINNEDQSIIDNENNINVSLENDSNSNNREDLHLNNDDFNMHSDFDFNNSILNSNNREDLHLNNDNDFNMHSDFDFNNCDQLNSDIGIEATDFEQNHSHSENCEELDASCEKELSEFDSEDDDDIINNIDDHTSEVLKSRSDEWMSRFVQIMEEVLTHVLQRKDLPMKPNLQPPWSICDGTKCLRKIFFNDFNIFQASSKLLEVFTNYDGEKGNNRTNISPQQFMEMYGYAVYLVHSLKQKFHDDDDIIHIEGMLSDLLDDIKQPKQSIENNMITNNVPDISDISHLPETDETQADSAEDTSYESVNVIHKQGSPESKNKVKVKIIRNIDLKKDIFEYLCLRPGSPNKLNGLKMCNKIKSDKDPEQKNMKDAIGPKVLLNFTKNPEFEARLKRKELDMDKLDYEMEEENDLQNKKLINDIDTKELNIRNIKKSISELQFNKISYATKQLSRKNGLDVKQFLRNLGEMFMLVKLFCENVATEIDTEDYVSDVKKKEFKKRTQETRSLLHQVVKRLKCISDRETSQANNRISRKSGLHNFTDPKTSKYRDIIQTCSEQANILLKSLNIIWDNILNHD